jgi:hypothetical protein
MSISNEPSEQVDHKVGNAAVACVLDLGDIVELLIDGFNQRPLAQQKFIKER